MCANYTPVTNSDELLTYFGVRRNSDDLPAELYPTDFGPFVRLVNGQREFAAGRFGLLPPWRRELVYGRNTYNSRSETVHSKPSFSDAWARGTRCVIPAKSVFEPRYYDDHTQERWRIEKDDGTPFGIAGVYNQWFEGDVEKFSYTMLTVNCDDHPFYSQFHQPGKEKRMPIFLDEEQYDDWMSCAKKDASRFFRQWTGAFRGAPAPLQPRPAKKQASQAVKPAAPPPPVQGGLF